MGLMSMIPSTTLYSGLVAGWFLDESTGTRTDIFGISNLTDNNSVGVGAGKVDNAAVFVAVNNTSLSTPNNPRMVFTDKLSMSCWCTATANVATGSLLTRELGAGFQFILEVSANSTTAPVLSVVCLATGGSDTVFLAQISDDTFDFTNFINVTVVIDGTQATNAEKMKMYVNGVYQTASDFGTGVFTTFDQSTQDTYVGDSETPGNYPFDGKIDHQFVWNRALTPQEVLHLYNTNLALRFPLG